MTEHKKKVLFDLMLLAEQRKAEADPNDERDSYYYGYYNGVEDAILDLGLGEEYEEYKKMKGVE